jgi:hypothetical protein
MSLVEHDADLWSVEHEFRWQAGLITIPVRMTIIRLSDERLVLHSPIPLSTELRAELDLLGTVGFIIVPDAHGKFADQVSEPFPAARLIAAPGPRSQRRSDPALASLSDHPPADWGGQIESLFLQGFRLNEVVLFHPPSQSLVITDLCFNIQRSASQFSRGFFKANGMWQNFGPSRLIRRLAVSNRRALRQSLEKVFAWPFDRIIPGHGDIIEHGGKKAIQAAWLS